MNRLLFCLLSLLLFANSPGANAYELAPHKDKLFGYPAILETSKNSKYFLVDYNRVRDMLERDQIPRRKAKFKYVDRSVGWSRRYRSYQSPNGKFKMGTVGTYSRKAKLVVIYVHGKGGNRRQGVNDWTFGGNFNRLQNLMNKNSGLLLTPDFSNFKDKGALDVASLIVQAKNIAPRARIVIACGSMGGGVCWRLANSRSTAKFLDGMIFLGSFWNDAFLKSSTLKKNTPDLPIFIGHGNEDVVFPPKRQLQFFKSITKVRKDYPIRFVMFNTGVHGTPIRMVDWRRELNWILSKKAQ